MLHVLDYDNDSTVSDDDDLEVMVMVLMFKSSVFLIYCNVTETDDDDRYVDDDDDGYVNDDDDDGIFHMLLFFLHFICLNFALFLQLTFLLSISFLNSAIHDEGPEI